MADASRPTRRRDWLSWTTFALGIAGLVVVAWVCVTEWGGVVHGHPAYAVLLAVTAVASILTAVRGLRGRRTRRGGWRTGGVVIVVVLGIGWLALIGWLRPYTAVEPALTAMVSDGTVTVTETPTQIVMTPTSGGSATGVFFQPGALVDARAYAAHLRPLAESGHTVVIPKQPLGIAFLATGAFDDARAGFPDIDGWVVGGHSLGGTVAAMQADAADSDAASPAVGLLFYASYPASDISGSLGIPVLSISGSRDGLATPDKIAASRHDLPSDAQFVQIAGGSHAQFGSYGPQAGDNTPTISAEDARRQISGATVQFVDGFGS
ncbi:alpha/beta hydrolase [Microbacterium rhizosphaerae]|uniref:Alpha/beta hydrolase n=1 Tax=Microbacterium rhizosphaerae TaxID=1678237 RepID=A0ABZ0SP70_9MICO|nr:alpha/beta hydrolase [Microbacterium rhizosphaerae]WPR89628.1 alpha/beta hydrolase [Microbacterium rhizosphaerae]